MPARRDRLEETAPARARRPAVDAMLRDLTPPGGAPRDAARQVALQEKFHRWADDCEIGAPAHQGSSPGTGISILASCAKAIL